MAEYADRPFVLLDLASFLDDMDLVKQSLFMAARQLGNVSPAAAQNWLVSFCAQKIASESLKRQVLQNKLSKYRTTPTEDAHRARLNLYPQPSEASVLAQRGRKADAIDQRSKVLRGVNIWPMP